LQVTANRNLYVYPHSTPMTTPASFRTSFAERNSKTHELRKDSLFNMAKT